MGVVQYIPNPTEGFGTAGVEVAQFYAPPSGSDLVVSARLGTNTDLGPSAASFLDFEVGGSVVGTLTNPADALALIGPANFGDQASALVTVFLRSDDAAGVPRCTEILSTEPDGQAGPAGPAGPTGPAGPPGAVTQVPSVILGPSGYTPADFPGAGPIFDRGHKPIVPDDARDPSRFGQPVETVKDALVELLRTHLARAQVSPHLRANQPTIESYAFDTKPNSTPYATFVQIYQEYPDVRERLPHIAVTSATGSNERPTAGRPFVGHVQYPPRVETANAEPYALPAPQTSITRVEVTAAAFQDYTITLWDGMTATYSALGTEPLEDIAEGLRRALVDDSALDQLLTVSRAGSVLTIETREVGADPAITVNANLTALETQAPQTGAPGRLRYRTTHRGEAREHVVLFRPERFQSGEDPTAATAQALARIINEQALYAEARVVDVAGSDGLRLQTGGELGQGTPNAVEVLYSEDSLATVQALGLADTGLGAAGDGVAAKGPTAPNTWVLTLVGAGFTAEHVGRYLTLPGLDTTRRLITAAPDADTLEFTDETGADLTLNMDGARWFVGYRDDWLNAARPVMNRYALRMNLNAIVEVFAESPNERREIADILNTLFCFNLEERHFTLWGRGVFDEQFGGEHWQISIGQDVRDGGPSDFNRPGDEKGRVYGRRITVPCTITMMVDYPVTQSTGPDPSDSWTVSDPDDQVLASDDLAPPN